MPHDQNTGGFFVCVLQKAGSPEDEPELVPDFPIGEAAQAGKTDEKTQEKADAPAQAEQTEQAAEGSNGLKRRAMSPTAEANLAKKLKAGPVARRQRRDPHFKEDPFSFVDPDHEEIKRISSVSLSGGTTPHC